MADEKKPIVVTQVVMPVLMLVTVAGGIAGGGIWLNDKLGNIDYRLTRIEEKIASPWTKDDMRAWADIFEVLNPGTRVPKIQ